MTARVIHSSVTHAAANPAALVDGPKWDADHIVTGLENVDNTSDLNKPVSSATQTAINAAVATGLSTCITKDGQTTTTAMVPFALGISVGDGTAAAPSITFPSDIDTGLFRKGANDLGFTVGGAEVADFSSAGLTLQVPLLGARFGAGTAAAPSVTFAGDLDTGFFSKGANDIGISVGGVEIADLSSTGLTLQVPLTGFVLSIYSFGARTTNTAAQNTTAIQNALNTGLSIYVPPGTWPCNKLSILLGNTKFFGASSGLSVLTSASTNTAQIEVAAALGNIEIYDLGLTRSVTATAGGTGVSFLGYVDTCKVRNLEVQKSYVGIFLSATGYSELSGCFIHDNRSDGIQMVNTAVYGTMQWYLHNNLVQANAGRGIVVAAIAGPSQVTLGDWIDNYTFANSSFGMAFAGLVGVPIQGVRIKGGFVGQDGNSEIFLDTYGGQHKINGTFTELAGTSTTGPGFATAASHTGNGIEITANNTDVTITNVVANGNSLYGINTLATTMTNVVGGRFATNSLYGIVFGDGTKAALTGTTFSSNTSGAVLVSSNASSLYPSGCFPTSLNVYPITVATTPVVSGSANGVLFTTSGGILASVTSVNSAIYTTTGAGAPQASTTLPAYTLGGTVSGGGNQINNVVIGASTPLAGTFTNVTLNTASPNLTLNKSASGQQNVITGSMNSLNRWIFLFGGTGAEGGGNTGSDWSLLRYDDAGAFLASAMTITRSSGAVSIPGALSKGSGTFLIDHPLDPENKDLYHGFVEAPRYDLIYRGKVQLINGVATVLIDPASNLTDGTFAALTQNAEVVSLNNLSGFTRVMSSAVEDGSFKITCEDSASSDIIHWVVIAERADPFIVHNEGAHTDKSGRMVPEQPKPPMPAVGELDEPAVRKDAEQNNIDPIAAVVEARRERENMITVMQAGTLGHPRHRK